MHGNLTTCSFLTLTLLLLEPVRFVKKLEDTTFLVGQPLKLSCSYTGSQRVFVTWKKDDKLIWASYKYNVKTTDSICVLDVLNSDRPEAAGKYTCEISNGVGTDVCHARVSLGKLQTLNMLPAFNSSAKFALCCLVGTDYCLSMLR